MMPLNLELGMSQSTSQAARSGPFTVESSDFIVGSGSQKATATNWGTIVLIAGIALVALVLGGLFIKKRK